eukprot:Nitzschia sp. Nitz4//scaffold3_size479765//385019//385345//NITZ4_000164-RA/size479765-exonerate_protein2genome-gene-1.370-mRNA-1//-1//CDS//3329550950//9446//frame0
MSILFRMKRPKSHFKGNLPGPNRMKPNAPSSAASIRTDVDNLAKFVFDSMNGLLYPDDKQVFSLHATKLLDNDGLCQGRTEFLIHSLGGSDEDAWDNVVNNSFGIVGP